ncbi:MAG: hypothetical protein ACM3Q2_11865, partial [Syntrophothermus sp.]
MKKIKKYVKYLLAAAMLCTAPAAAQYKLPEKGGVFIDKNGIMRWEADSSEAALFGVNYTAPFAYSYRALKKLNLSVKDAIDTDVRQMKRLGFNAFRVHVWDREISDENGNLIVNEHLDLFDYLLKQLAENGIKSIITPIAWWGNGWPEPDEKTNGFSELYSKQELITDPKAIGAQKNYLRQFLTHKNKYSGFAYKDDPSVIAVEIINEPKHPADTKLVTAYINQLASAVRETKFAKPVFYNISENWSEAQANAVADAEIDGISFQWYPTALVHNHMLEGNYLLNVDNYNIPSENIKGFKNKTKMVYEFDAADIGASYMYPAIARSFRKAGMQFAAMFSYDPSQIAWSNTEYPTHFMNLLYTPSKAISLMIAAKAFMRIPMYKDYGSFPDNMKFGDFRVSYCENLSEMNTPQEFYYSNTTKTHPLDISKLEHIAGCGSSSVISFSGTGAYFLDKAGEGIYKLEVNPDAVWIRDPFGRTSLSHEAARLDYNESEMKISLPALSDKFFVYSLDPDLKMTRMKVSAGCFRIKPGSYILSRRALAGGLVNDFRKRTAKMAPLYIPVTEASIDNDKTKRNLNSIIPDSSAFISLFDPKRDREKIIYPFWNPVQKFYTEFRSKDNSSDTVFTCRVEMTGKQTRPFAFMNYAGSVRKLDKKLLGQYKAISFKGKAFGSEIVNLRVSLLLTDGTCFGLNIKVDDKMKEIEIPLSSLVPQERIILPDCYPLFLIEGRTV